MLNDFHDLIALILYFWILMTQLCQKKKIAAFFFANCKQSLRKGFSLTTNTCSLHEKKKDQTDLQGQCEIKKQHVLCAT